MRGSRLEGAIAGLRPPSSVCALPPSEWDVRSFVVLLGVQLGVKLGYDTVVLSLVG